VAAQCVLLGVFFVGRIFTGLLQAHHRFDLLNYSQIAQLIIMFAAQWIAFHIGWGLYSLLVANLAGSLLGFFISLFSVLQLKLLPARGCWGRPSRTVFGDLFAFARDMFLMVVGLQLLNASQLIVISRTLGLSAAAVWSVANKAVPVAFQGVSRIFDFSGSALGELHIRGERDKLRRRYADVLLLTASAAVFAGAALAVCNTSFMMVWTKGEISWPRRNDVLLGLLLAITCVTRCSIGLSAYLKNVGPMRWIYLFEGVSFFVMSLLTAHYLGMTGILSAAILANVVWSGGYGFRRTAQLLAIATSEVIGWLKTAGNYLLLMAPMVALLWWIASRVPLVAGLVTNIVVMGTLGFGLFWLIGLTPDLRAEIKSTFRKLIS
jgi:O-antigen/teichoic acid export membrane protein